MTTPPLPRTTRELLRTVRVYADEDAFQRDERGRSETDFRLKAIHDDLFQAAIDLKLATLLSVLDWKRPAGFRTACGLEVERASWWPGNVNASNKRDLLTLLLAPNSEAVLGKAWLTIRGIAEQDHRTTLWHDDPALAFAAAPGIWLGRAACVGHEGLVYYFAYGQRERDWEGALQRAGLKVLARGETAYRQYFQVPGCLGGQ
jgi:hypothetical protein